MIKNSHQLINLFNINQVNYFNDIFQGIANVTADETVIITNLDYFNNLGKLLESTPKR